ncbi:MAG: 2-C-methyl-D-erythritol 2,4-cyclodiphosphate synthase, partial [Pedobacter sp.]
MKIKVGFGFDVHQLKDNHPFYVGGVNLEHHKGAFGHSDADVLLHAICDALLG